MPFWLRPAPEQCICPYPSGRVPVFQAVIQAEAALISSQVTVLPCISGLAAHNRSQVRHSRLLCLHDRRPLANAADPVHVLQDIRIILLVRGLLGFEIVLPKHITGQILDHAGARTAAAALPGFLWFPAGIRSHCSNTRRSGATAVEMHAVVTDEIDAEVVILIPVILRWRLPKPVAETGL